MIELATEADLQKLITNGTQESLTLDYKRSDALGRESKQRNEICKDVSAFANSAGGQIVYGVAEEAHRPVRIDQGLDPSVITRESLEQLIDGGVRPRIDGLKIVAIPLNAGKFAYAVTVPQSAYRAPHQAPDHRYYKRQNFQSVPMEDYEIRDVLRRATTPKLAVSMSLLGGDEQAINWPNESEESTEILFKVLIRNESQEPAIYTIISIFLDDALVLKDGGGFRSNGKLVIDGNDVRQYVLRIGPPDNFPIFREITFQLANPHISVALKREQFFGRDARFIIGYSTATPGFFDEKFGELLLLQKRMRVVWQGKENGSRGELGRRPTSLLRG